MSYPKMISDPHKTVMVVSSAQRRSSETTHKKHESFALKLLLALYTLSDSGYTTVIYGDIGETEQLLLSMLAQIRNTYPDKAFATIKIEVRCDFYRNGYAGREYSPNFIHFIDEPVLSPDDAANARRNPVTRFLTRNSSAILFCGATGSKEAEALKTAFPFKLDYKKRHPGEFRFYPPSPRRLEVQVYEK